MSTTTMLESYDTQMLDYPNDLDVPMLPSSELWFHPEAIMEDDQNQILHKNNPVGLESHTVEVDMDGYGDETAEYEMADEEDSFPVDEGELVDVEVYDATEAQMPDSIIETHMSSEGQTDAEPASSSHYTDALPPLAVTISDIPAESHSHEGGSVIASDYHANTPSPSMNTQHQSVVIEIEGHPRKEISLRPDEMNVVHNPDNGASVGSTHATEERSNEEYGGDQNGVDTHVAENENTAQEVILPHDVDALQPVPQSEDGDHTEPSHHEIHEEATTSADPHEIADGVYIDPPPAVLLSLPGSEQQEVCLFNQPVASPASPEQSESQLLTLLLSHRPILYYEPLATVFEALRQEEFVARMPELTDGELVLNAVDLQLVISEDNVHAREVSLHDLNVLHDGSDFAGPLQLHLRTIVPRFINRYQALREQISRTTLATEFADDYVHHTSEEDQEVHVIENPEVVPENPEDQPEDVVSNNHEQSVTNQAEYHKDTGEHIGEELPDDISGSKSEDHDHPLAREQEEFRDSVAVLEEPSENLAEKSDVSHPTHSDPDVQDYTEYEEYTEESKEFDGTVEDPVPEDLVGSDQGTVQDETGEREETATVDDNQETFTQSLQEAPPQDPVEQETAAAASDGQGNESTASTLDAAQPDLQIGPSHTTEHSFRENPDQNNIEVVDHVDESDSNFIAMLEQEADLADPPGSGQQSMPEVIVAGDPEDLEEEWDDSLDGEGDPDTNWEVEVDAASNQSSVTLSSMTSSKRGFDEVEFDDFPDDEPSRPDSPDSKRPRVQ